MPEPLVWPWLGAMSGPTYNMPSGYRFTAHTITKNGWCANRRAKLAEQRAGRNELYDPNLSQKAQEWSGQTIVDRAPLAGAFRALKPPHILGR